MDVTATRASTGSAGTKTHYRTDIQGLRGIGVLAVVSYHAGVPLPGGFFAVDSFFVISGFVIAGVLLRDLEKTGRFSARTFYMRRARRLLPAAGVMITVTVLASGLLLSPLGVVQRATGEAAMAASTFTANLYFMVTTGGYFQPSATSNPFLHMWTLSVEEQFYVVLPWVLLIGWLAFPRRRVRAIAVVAVIAWLLSMAANLMLSFQWLPAFLPAHDLLVADGGVRALAVSFFSPVTRSWEFLTGVIVLLATRRYIPSLRISPAMSWVGLGLLLGSFLLINEDRPLPGVASLIPVIGTSLVLLAGSSVQLKALTQRQLVGMGDISYSWYLWHWPIILIAVVWFDSTLVALLAGVLSLPMSWVAFRIVEKTIRDRSRFPTDKAMAVLAVACIVVPFIAGLALVRAWQHNWWDPEVTALRSQLAPVHLDEADGCSAVTGLGPAQVCSYTVPDAKGTVLLVGDSTAGMFSEPVRAATHNLGYDLDVASRSACPLQLGLPGTAQSCARFVSEALRGITDRAPAYSAVVVVNAGRYGFSATAPGTMRPAPMQPRYDAYADAVGAAIEQIESVSPVLLVKPAPQATGGRFPECVLPSVLVSPRWDCARLEGEYLATTSVQTAQALDRRLGSTATLYDPSAHLCDEQVCFLGRDGRFAYRDETHLTVDQSLVFTTDIQQVLQQTLSEEPTPGEG